MKKLIKYMDSTDPKFANLQFGSSYGSFINIMTSLVTSTGFNNVNINKIIKTDGIKEVTFYFTTPANYNHKIGEVVNITDNRDQEYVIIAVDTVNNAFIKCEYYDDYIISTNETYTGVLVNSSFGMNLESNVDGKLVVSDEYKVAKYTFYDNVSTNFLNTDTYKIVGMYMSAYNNPAIYAPFLKVATDYNNTVDWVYGSYTRRCLMNLMYMTNSQYIIVGNGNFIYFIVGNESLGKVPYVVHCFGVFKSYKTNDLYNAIMVSRNYNNNMTSQSINTSTPYNSTSYSNSFGCYFNDSSLYKPSTYNETIAASTAITDNAHNTQILYGDTTPAGFTLAPNMFFPTTIHASGESFIPYPNSSNKMLLSSVNIISGTNTATNIPFIHGSMPFMYWYGHPKSSATGNLLPININDNGKNRRFLVINTINILMHIEITPNSANNYYKG